MSTQGWCVWITGLPGSGKSTIAEILKQKLEKENIRVQILQSDALRKLITPNPTYVEKERNMVYEALVMLAKHLTRYDVNVLIDATGNLRQYRASARQQIPKFIEAYLECSLETCSQREAKRENTRHAPTGIYEKALDGSAPTVPGVGAVYEPPLRAEVTLDTEKLTPDECAERILETILQRFY